jgi:hypothetical protein
VLTRRQWRGVVDFSRAVNAEIVTSFTISDGVRDAKGVWTPDQARKLLAFTKTLGGSIAAAEFFNEPTFAAMGGAPKDYDAAAYGRDFRIFLPFARKSAPEMLILGPGSIGEAAPMGGFPALKTEEVDHFPAFGWSHPGCQGPSRRQREPERERTEAWGRRRYAGAHGHADSRWAGYASAGQHYLPGLPECGERQLPAGSFSQSTKKIRPQMNTDEHR